MKGIALFPLLLVAAHCLLLVYQVHAWIPYMENKIQWDYGCDFDGQTLLEQATENTNCGETCLWLPECTHWAWYVKNGGTCSYKKGRNNTVRMHSASNCGFTREEFTLNEHKALDLDTESHITAPIYTENLLSGPDGDKMAKSLEFFRKGSGKDAFGVDVRLMLIAQEMARQCPKGDAKFQEKPVAKYGFNDRVQVLHMVRDKSDTVPDIVQPFVTPDSSHASVILGDYNVWGYAKDSNVKCGDGKAVWVILVGSV